MERARVISKESVSKANKRVSNGHSCVTGRNNEGVTAIAQTSFGRFCIVVSHKAVAEAGAKALRGFSK